MNKSDLKWMLIVGVLFLALLLGFCAFNLFWWPDMRPPTRQEMFQNEIDANMVDPDTLPTPAPTTEYDQ